MDAPRRLDLADPDFEPAPLAVARLRDFDPRDHQRLVVNPFLAVLAGIVVFQGVRRLFASDFPPLAIVLLVALPFLPNLIQFHCLDCGGTGRYVRRDRHACPAVVARWNQKRSANFASSRSQLIVWGWVLGSVAVLVLILDWL